MSSYAVVETVVVILIGLVSAYQVMRVLMPRATQRLHAVIATRVDARRGGGRSLATRLNDAGAGSGCAIGCGSGCNGCIAAAGIDQPPVERQEPSR